MAKAASGSQAGQVVPRGAGSRQAAGPPTGSQGALRRRTSESTGLACTVAITSFSCEAGYASFTVIMSTAASGRGSGGGGLRQGVTNFYTDESPGIKVSPVRAVYEALLQLSKPHIAGPNQHV